MFRIDKLLQFFFIVILVIIGVEVYILTNNPFTQSKTASNQTITQPQRKTVTNDKATQTGEIISKTVANINSDIITSSHITNTYKGTVASIDLKPGETSSGFKYELALRIKSLTKNDTTGNFLFNKDDLSKMKFYEVNDGNLTPIDADQLKKGDYISYEIVTDLTRKLENNTVSGTIKKYNDKNEL